ncbi:hypothetical protein ACEPBM_003532 [Vibrio cholerae]
MSLVVMRCQPLRRALCINIEMDNMTFISNTKNIDSIKEEYSVFLNLLEPIIKKIRRRSDLRNTKLWAIKRNLDKFDELSIEQQNKLVSIVVKYVLVNNILNPVHEIEITNKEVLNLITQGFYFDDSDQKYNDYFFELIVASRFLNEKKPSKINLGTICDVIIDNELAIECKYIHKKENLYHNIEYAMKQVDNRVESNLAQYGFVALDISNVIDFEAEREFARVHFNRFYDDNRYGKDFVGILNLEGFKVPVKERFLSAARDVFLSAIEGHCLDKDIRENTRAILIQINTSFSVETPSEIIPVPFRFLDHYINPNLDSLESNKIKQRIMSLCKGI